MTTSTNNKNDDTDNNKWIQWIKNGIANEYISYHDYNEFQNIEYISNGNVYRANWKSSNTVVVLKSSKNIKGFIREIVNEVFIIIITIFL
jgi:hypothetical protein